MAGKWYTRNGPEEKPEYPPIEGWWTIGEAPNYEVDDDGNVRHKPSGREVQHRKPGPNHEPRVTLSANGKIISRRVKDLVETGRKYQGH